MIARFMIITGVVVFIAACHGLNAIGWVDVPDILLDPIFDFALFVSAALIVFIMFFPMMLLQILLLLGLIWLGFAYIYANYVMQII